MNSTFTFLTSKAKSIAAGLAGESGQDLIEYALVVALIAFAAVAGMSTVASNISTAFSSIGSQVVANT